MIKTDLFVLTARPGNSTLSTSAEVGLRSLNLKEVGLRSLHLQAGPARTETSEATVCMYSVVVMCEAQGIWFLAWK